MQIETKETKTPENKQVQKVAALEVFDQIMTAVSVCDLCALRAAKSSFCKRFRLFPISPKRFHAHREHQLYR